VSPRRRLISAAALALLSAPLGARAEAPLCARGKRQSPIDIAGATRRDLPPLSFDYRPEPLRIVHDGHTVRVRCSASTMRVGPEPHRLQQFHFHLPGGDTIGGETFPLGMHFPHKSRSGQLVTLVLLFRDGRAHAALDALLPWLPQAGAPERTVANVSSDPAAWLPAARGYYRYSGSLTSPPCTEGVTWLVLRQAQEVSQSQLDRLRRLIAPNARPIQPRNGREILESA
jgi:carbonic anhydrase